MSPDYVVVTLRTASGSFESDYELPANLPVERLSQLLLVGLAQQSPRLFGGWKDLFFRREGRLLRAQDTLSALGVWDGSVLTIGEVPE